jgi:hypothetical protein
MNELRGMPGNNCSPVRAPTSPNGIERIKTNRKNFRGDLLRDAMLFANSFSDILVPASPSRKYNTVFINRRAEDDLEVHLVILALIH